VGMNKQLKIGFGIGCGFLVVVFLLIAGGGTYWATNTGRDFKVVIKAEKELNKEYGVLEEYAPGGEGLPEAGRVETFLQVRQSLSEYHSGMEISLEEYIAQKEKNAGGGLLEGINMVRAGAQLGPAYARFWLARNEKLLEYGMGAGEYSYIYCLAYYGYLGHDPADGVTGMGGVSPSEASMKVKVVISDPAQELSAADKARRRTSKMVVSFLEKIEFSTGENQSPESGVWQGEVEAEKTRLQQDRFLIPFHTSVSNSLAGVFENFRTDLENVYVPRVNPLELFFQQEEIEDDESDPEQ